MNTPSKSELRTLMEKHNGSCVSMFLPTQRTGMETQKAQLSLRNHIREAEHRLFLDNLSSRQVEEFLEPIQALLDDEQFWLDPGDGLALFRSPDLFRYYRWPFHLKEQVIVTDHFYLKPLLPALANDERFYILALSQKENADAGRASNNIGEVVPAAYYGRVESLFIAIDQELWGIFNPITSALHVHSVARYRDDDLLDVAATQTLLHSGSVYAVERAKVPGGGPIAAVFRY